MAAFLKEIDKFYGTKEKTGREKTWRPFWSTTILISMRHQAVPQMR